MQLRVHDCERKVQCRHSCLHRPLGHFGLHVGWTKMGQGKLGSLFKLKDL